MVVIEYRIPLPFTLDEFSRGFDYLCARQAKEVMRSSTNQEKVERLEESSFDEIPSIIATHGCVVEREKIVSDAILQKNRQKKNCLLSTNSTVTSPHHQEGEKRTIWKTKTGNPPPQMLPCYYIKNKINLGTRLPSWLRKVVPTAALTVYEEYWSAYPYTFCRYTSALWPGHLVNYTIESLHVVGDVGKLNHVFLHSDAPCLPPTKTDEASGASLSLSSLQKSATAAPSPHYHFYPTTKMEILDISAVPKDEEKKIRKKKHEEMERDEVAGVYQGDPTRYRSLRTGRGPLVGPQWWLHQKNEQQSDEIDENRDDEVLHQNKRQQHSLPVMCIYKRASCQLHFVPDWIGGAKVENIILDSTVKQMALHCFKNMFCWMDEWMDLTKEEIHQEIAQADGQY